MSDTLNSWIIGRARTPRGLSYYTWAPNKFAAGASLLALIAADLGLNVEAYRAFAKSQVGGQRETERECHVITTRKGWGQR